MYRPEKAGARGPHYQRMPARIAVGRRAKRTPQGKRLPRRVEDGLRVVQLVVAARRSAAEASAGLVITVIYFEEQRGRFLRAPRRSGRRNRRRGQLRAAGAV